MSSTGTTVEQQTGALFGELWDRYDDALFKESVELFSRRWLANGEPADFFRGKHCLDVGCGGGRYSIAMALMGAESVTGMDVGTAGLEDAGRRAEALGATGVTFREGSVLDLPAEDGSFDFVCCAGVLMITPSPERGLGEIHRVLTPGGTLYTLLYGAGGLYWPLNAVCRSFAGALGLVEVERCIEAAGLAANKRRTVLDDLFVPILETYARERVDHLMADAGFASWRWWATARNDHETDPETLVAELRQREAFWRAGADSAGDARAGGIEAHLADICRSVADAGAQLVEHHHTGELDDEALRDAVLGTGHHRVIAQRP